VRFRQLLRMVFRRSERPVLSEEEALRLATEDLQRTGCRFRDLRVWFIPGGSELSPHGSLDDYWQVSFQLTGAALPPGDDEGGFIIHARTGAIELPKFA
jgi:hypothetical protein